ncbi:lytic transglycosylase domain-containing protein [Kineococcus sp. SYSU DK018]|uniref:lytic transglycosylase domain-containing protein n=1 Tax=Kineococcus sp. SYSU DK018 TaxID=3383139 RepID=UPI003D7EA1D5
MRGTQRRRGPRATALSGALTTALALALAGVPVVPAAATGTATGTAAEAAAARAAAEQAGARAREVHDALERQRAAARTAAVAAVRAEEDARRQRTAAHSASGDGARRARALYMGPAGGLGATDAYALVRSLLSGTDPAAALRARDLSGERALTAGGRATAAVGTEAAARAAAAAAASAEADRAAVDGVAALRELSARSDLLAQALQQAQEHLAALDADAARLRAAEEAERALAAAREVAAAAATSAAAATTGVRAGSAPADYADLYARAATTCPGMRPALLQAVGQVESGHGRDVGPSSAGAIGPMQFVPATFAAYGVDGDGDGDTDARDPADAIFSAARYLCANGAGAGRGGESGALFRYNRADWYVVMVQRIADEIDAA